MLRVVTVIIAREKKKRFWPMAIDPLELDQTEKQHLSELAERTGDERVRAAVTAYLEESVKKTEPNGAPTTKAARPIWEEIADITSDLPMEEFRKLPRDGAEQLDHYIYGTPKRSS